MRNESESSDPILRRFKTHDRLSRLETEVIKRVDRGPRQLHPEGAILADEGEAESLPQFLTSGWAANERRLEDGRRQFISLLIPGDGFGLSTPTRPITLASVRALTPVETVDGEAIRQAILQRHRFPGIAAVYDAAVVEEDALLLDHVVRLGSGSSLQRLAHLLMELHLRCRRVGLAQEDSFPMPLTQAMLGSLLGLSVVQVNRAFKELRRKGLILTGRREIVVRDVKALRQVGHFRVFRMDGVGSPG